MLIVSSHHDRRLPSVKESTVDKGPPKGTPYAPLPPSPFPRQHHITDTIEVGCIFLFRIQNKKQRVGQMQVRCL